MILPHALIVSHLIKYSSTVWVQIVKPLQLMIIADLIALFLVKRVLQNISDQHRLFRQECLSKDARSFVQVVLLVFEIARVDKVPADPYLRIIVAI